MKYKTILSLLALAAILPLLAPTVALCNPQEAAEAAPQETRPVVHQSTASPRYSSLAELVMRVCEEASGTFHDFFSSSLVRVVPFARYDGIFERNTQLGVTFADQMAAAISGRANAAYDPRASTDQELNGVLQEMDGYLRVHISGTNSWGERRSYVAAVEMSEPVYRALHTKAEVR